MSSLNVDRTGRPRPGIPMRPLLRLPGKIPRAPGRTTGSSPAASADQACGAMLPPTVGRDETWGAAVSPVIVTRPCYLRLPGPGARTLRRKPLQFTSGMSLISGNARARRRPDVHRQPFDPGSRVPSLSSGNAAGGRDVVASEHAHHYLHKESDPRRLP